jgi:hypothetical protein
MADSVSLTLGLLTISVYLAPFSCYKRLFFKGEIVLRGLKLGCHAPNFVQLSIRPIKGTYLRQNTRLSHQQ